jgi:hypothetical protein
MDANQQLEKKNNAQKVGAHITLSVCVFWC